MTTLLITLIVAAVAAIAALLVALLHTREQNARLGQQLQFITKEQSQLKEQSRLAFRDVSAQLLAEQGHDLNQESNQRLEQTLAPLRANLESLRQALDGYKSQQASSTGALQQQLNDLRELNQGIGREARELAQALRGDSKVQGDWGEMVLTRLLEISGLKQGENFDTQMTRDSAGNLLHSDEGGLLRPDVVLHLPGGRELVVDSKVSLTSYAAWTGAQSDNERKQALQRHVASVRKHVDELAAKAYDKHVPGSADFVLMFIPNEPAYLLAMNADSGLWEEAYKKRVVIVTPTHLMAVVRLIAQLWERDKQSRNAQAIATEAGNLINKLVDFVNDLNNVEKALQSAQKACDAARSKLSEGRGNLLSRARKLADLGAKATKQLPQQD